ncbi:hypothetical protein ACFL27_11855 [candidate division CSSED10-310 bacterium]|uniref:Transposase n=1 Tax=candidate division CSSED10-310 bacterium TaxID=2855610 RepID=A0ABV6YXE6_UNCC1
MWLFTIYGMYSATMSEKDRDIVKVRARNAQHLKNLINRFPVKLKKHSTIHTDVGTDYHARLFVPKNVWADIVTQLTLDVDYSNFKDRAYRQVSKTRDNEYNTLLHQIWEFSYRYQNEVIDN